MSTFRDVNICSCVKVPSTDIP